jgi:ribonuclease P protein component
LVFDEDARKFSFSRDCRLVGPQAFSAVFAFKCWVSGNLFQVYAGPRALPLARLGIVASKRVMSRAVTRNYCKRLAREVFRAERAALTDIDIVVRARLPVTPALSEAARAEFRDLLFKAQRQCRLRACALKV